VTHDANLAAGAPGYGGMLSQYLCGRPSAWKMTPSRYAATHGNQLNVLARRNEERRAKA
jgi:hypothetical protein